ncbi:MAG: efflux RND transporter periplasmic adaptor subunit [Kordiimonadaceae bacterium]|nr:efflux RND transporter periplasmic adaptor subunit [Kordiimonadaceae bacterium]MBO6568779.1 efflux RND transporter periplasmic adaptor subunit [Kordiimonadaceae bacterium]MBO6965245.1 efflux RND transporter periplasmic adaptor subunit [Kordiimonadaceae bacterium]
MNRVLKAIHTAKSNDTASGLLQIVFVVLVVGGTIGLTGLLNLTADSGPALSPEPEQVVVDVLVPNQSAHTASRRLSGQVEARANVAISPQVTGRVVGLHDNLVPGGTIGAGETLFSLDPTDYEIALERSRADVAAAAADLEQARADASNFVKDWERVYPDRPAPALVAKEPQIRAIEARLAAAKANVRQAEVNLARTNVTAKNDIRIIESNIELDQLVGPNGQYGSFYVANALRIRASAETAVVQALGLAPGKTAKVRVDGVDTTLLSELTSVGSALDERTRLQPLILSVPTGATLTPGQFVSLDVSGRLETGVFRLPAAAMATRTSVWRVANSRLEEHNVDIVDTADDFVVVRSFDPKDGIVISQVPTSFVARPVKIRHTQNGDAS